MRKLSTLFCCILLLSAACKKDKNNDPNSTGGSAINSTDLKSIEFKDAEPSTVKTLWSIQYENNMPTKILTNKNYQVLYTNAGDKTTQIKINSISQGITLTQVDIAYNNQGLPERIDISLADSTNPTLEKLMYYTYTYTSGKLTRKDQYMALFTSQMKLVYYYLYDIDANGDIKSMTHYRDDGSIARKFVYESNNKENKFLTVFRSMRFLSMFTEGINPDQLALQHFENQYMNAHYITKETVYDEDGTIEDQITYTLETDAAGRLIKKKGDILTDITFTY